MNYPFKSKWSTKAITNKTNEINEIDETDEINEIDETGSNIKFRWSKDVG